MKMFEIACALSQASVMAHHAVCCGCKRLALAG